MNIKVFSGELLNEECILTIVELSEACQVSNDWVVLLVNEGILQPLNKETGKNHQWTFTGNSLYKARMTRWLELDLGVNIAGAAVALELMDENELLQHQIKILEHGNHYVVNQVSHKE